MRFEAVGMTATHTHLHFQLGPLFPVVVNLFQVSIELSNG